MTLMLLLACGRLPKDATAYPAALVAVAADPAQAVGLCGDVPDEALRADCVSSGAERLAGHDADGAMALCTHLEAGSARDECGFQVAEKSGEVARCTTAGRFSDDCRLHLWSQALPGLVSGSKGPGEVEPVARAALASYGFAEGDLRPWSALYREVLSEEKPLDRGSCVNAPSPELADACRRTGAVLYSDRLNHARDHRQFPCDGGPMPALLQTAPDPELAAMVAQRRGDDLCPGSAP